MQPSKRGRRMGWLPRTTIPTQRAHASVHTNGSIAAARLVSETDNRALVSACAVQEEHVWLMPVSRGTGDVHRGRTHRLGHGLGPADHICWLISSVRYIYVLPLYVLPLYLCIDSVDVEDVVCRVFVVVVVLEMWRSERRFSRVRFSHTASENSDLLVV
jgi:hypothetical protein